MLLHKELTDIIINSAIEVHKELGPGLLENTYEECLLYELLLKNMKVERQKELSVIYINKVLECGYRLDLVVEDKVIVELKAVESLNSIHDAQLLTYLKLSKIKVGLLINFNVKYLKDGIKRFVL